MQLSKNEGLYVCINVVEIPGNVNVHQKCYNQGEFMRNNMGLRELIKKDLDDLRTDELVIISEQIRLLKRLKPVPTPARPIEEIRKMTAASKSNWAEDIIRERQERG